MAQNDAEWRLEQEEAAQGQDLFKAAGRGMQSSEAEEDAAEFTAGGAGTERVEKARVRRRSLGGAMTVLEDVVAGPSGAAGWHEAVAAALEELRLALDDHIAVTEGEGGLFAEILDLAPRYAAEVDLTAAEHEGLVEALDKARLTLDAVMDTGPDDPEPVRRRVMTLVSRLSQHRQRGADLVYNAYNVDIATAD